MLTNYYFVELIMKEILIRALQVSYGICILFIIWVLWDGVDGITGGIDNLGVWIVVLMLAVPTWILQFIVLGIINPIKLFIRD
jgi:hypothetical protein